MRSTPLNVSALVVAAGLVTIPLDGAMCRAHPDRPLPIPGPQPVTSATGEFNCGTYRSNGYRDHWYASHHAAALRESAAGSVRRVTAAPYVYDDVWVVEDDGTLTISGTNLFDTQITTFRFTPNGGGYDVNTVPQMASFPFGEDLALGDDEEATRPLSFTFPFYGTDWTEVHIGANGAVALGAALNPSGFFDPDDFFSPTPKIAPYYMDLDPTIGTGTPAVYFKSGGDSAVATWSSVNELGSSRKNTFQLVLRADGSFDFAMISIQSTAAINGSPVIMGIHPGGAPAVDRFSYSDDVPYSGAAGVGIYEDYLSLANPAVNETALGQTFYQSFPDDFFQYVYFTNFSQTMGGFANEVNISNDVTGIGLPIFDNSALYGSGGVLESRCNMNQLSAWVTDPTTRFRGTQSFLTIMGQEAGHRWGAFVRFLDGANQPSNMMLGRADAHWSYYSDVDHSCLEGGNWIATGINEWLCPDNVDLFSEIDEYLFGLRTAEEVSDMFYVSSGFNDVPTNRDNPPPPAGVTAYGTAIPVTVGDFIAWEGPRTPAPADENRDLRQAFIFLLASGTTATQAQLDKIAGFRRAWEEYFARACDGRLTCNTSVTQTRPVAAVEGHVVSSATLQPVDEIVVFSRQRGFRQHVPAGGRYTFRYLAPEGAGATETVTLVAQAPGFFPDSVTTAIAYGGETTLDIELDPDPFVSVAIASFTARPRAGGVELSARFASSYDASVLVRVYRALVDSWETIATLPHEGEAEFRYTDRTAAPGQSYRYRIGVSDADGEFLSPERRVEMPRVAASLEQNVPNPFNPSTTIRFVLPAEERVHLCVYDASGRLVASLVDGFRGPGVHAVTWDGTGSDGAPVGSGVYFYRIVAGRFAASEKMVLVK